MTDEKKPEESGPKYTKGQELLKAAAAGLRDKNEIAELYAAVLSGIELVNWWEINLAITSKYGNDPNKGLPYIQRRARVLIKNMDKKLRLSGRGPVIPKKEIGPWISRKMFVPQLGAFYGLRFTGYDHLIDGKIYQLVELSPIAEFDQEFATLPDPAKEVGGETKPTRPAEAKTGDGDDEAGD